MYEYDELSIYRGRDIQITNTIFVVLCINITISHINIDLLLVVLE